MKAKVNVDAGICGFQTSAVAAADEDQQVVFDVQSTCEKIRALAELLKAKGAIDAYQEISPAGEGVLMQTVRPMQKGCCAGCVVPVALFKGMQVAAGLALPKDVSVGLARQ